MNSVGFHADIPVTSLESITYGDSPRSRGSATEVLAAQLLTGLFLCDPRWCSVTIAPKPPAVRRDGPAIILRAPGAAPGYVLRHDRAEAAGGAP